MHSSDFAFLTLQFCVDEGAQLLDSLMVVVEGFHFGEEPEGTFVVAHAEVAEGEHVFAVDEVLRVERVFPDEEVGQGDCEVVHDLFFEDVLLAIVDEAVEASVCLTFATEFQKCHALVEYLVGFGIVVVHGCSWFLRSQGCLFPTIGCFLLLSECVVGDAEQVVEVVFLCSVEFSFAEVVRVFKTFAEQSDGFFVFLSGECLFCQFDAAYLILSADFSFASFPWVEDTAVEFLHCFCIVSCLVEKGYLFEYEVVAALDEIGVFLQECQTLCMWTVESFVELVEFHEYAFVVFIEVECAFHVFECFLLTVLFVEASECEVAPYGGELRVELCGEFPVFDGKVVLTCSVVETTQVVGSLTTFTI